MMDKNRKFIPNSSNFHAKSFKFNIFSDFCHTKKSLMP